MSANPGRAWELLLVGLHKRYARERLAVVDRSSPEIRVISVLPKGRFVGCHEKTGPVDFLGTISGSGRSIVFDAKWTDARRFSLANVLEHQAVSLNRHCAAGAVAGIALGTPRGCFWLPWAALAERDGAVDPAAVGVPFELAWHPSGKDPVPVGDGWLPCVSR